ncbi:hypothetical protein FQN50_005436 [Emmonsiellopsis sp. PD_5]|nr:hypothetical protein FQN50_005436 [Emmonsiellopsis sp. PD_5]
MSQRLYPQRFNDIKRTILSTDHSVDLEFPNIPPDEGHLLARSFCEDPDIERAHPRISFNSQTLLLTARIKPIDVHDCGQEWLEKELRDMLQEGFITSAERNELKIRVGTTFDAFVSPYASSSKEPDVCIRPDNLTLPTIAVESGWSDARPRFLADKDLWLVGGPTVEAVFLVQWAKVAGGHIKGYIELYARTASRDTVLVQTEPIFPVPSTDQNQSIPITRGQVFGPSLPAGRNPGDIYHLSIANLRAEAEGSIRAMGFTPAL